ncbi:MAG: hypothetical protein HY422_00440 [Candidatus Komeilibacteria bacterium]|nr:hypothetical protein [Candidatus Komeilibacteria bacterium]
MKVYVLVAVLFFFMSFVGNLCAPLFVAWPFALFFGFGFMEKLQRSRLNIDDIAFMFWTSFWVGVGSMPTWLMSGMHPGFFGGRWWIIGPAVTATLYLTGNLLYLAIRMIRILRRNRWSDKSSGPPSGNRSSSAMPHKLNPTQSERDKSLLYSDEIWLHDEVVL